MNQDKKYYRYNLDKLLDQTHDSRLRYVCSLISALNNNITFWNDEDIDIYKETIEQFVLRARKQLGADSPESWNYEDINHRALRVYVNILQEILEQILYLDNTNNIEWYKHKN